MPEYQQLMDRLADGDVIILDGANGSEIQRLGVDMHENAWCALATETHPDVVRAIHENYIRAGAEIITTNTYASGRQFLEDFGGDGTGSDMADKTDELCRRSTELAFEAREAAGNGPVWIAGSISAIGTLDRLGEARMRASFARQAEVLAESGVDLLLLEMLACDGPLSVVAIEEAKKTGLPIWVALSCMADDTSEIALGARQRTGTQGRRYGTGTFGESAAEIAKSGGDVFFVFHSQVEIAREALRQLKESLGGPVGIYPHCGDFEAPDWQFVNMISPEDYLEEAKAWVSDGAQIVGGCCGIGLDHMKLLRDGLPRKIQRN